MIFLLLFITFYDELRVAFLRLKLSQEKSHTKTFKAQNFRYCRIKPPNRAVRIGL